MQGNFLDYMFAVDQSDAAEFAGSVDGEDSTHGTSL
jgi:hypothetical protein